MSGNTMGTCPLGGLWYTCTSQTPTFLGCCTSNPCQGDNTGCPSHDLRAAGMGTGAGPDGLSSNDASYWPNVQCSAGLWYTCAFQTPTFQGCCDVDPCKLGTSCPASALHPAAFKSVPVDTAITLTAGVTTSTKISSSSSKAQIIDTTTSSSITSVTSSTAQSASSSTETAGSAESTGTGSESDKDDSGPNIGAIAGGAAGGIAVLMIGLLILWKFRRRRQKAPVLEHHDSTSSAIMKDRGGASVFAAESDDGQPRPYNSEAYYAGQSIFGVPHPVKYAAVPTSPSPISPGPPPYKSQQSSPNPNIHEIDSADVYEAAGTVHAQHSDNRASSSSQRGTGLGVRSAAELPHSPVTEKERRGSSRLGGEGTGDESMRGETSSLVSDGRLSVNENRRVGRESYVSWQTLSS